MPPQNPQLAGPQSRPLIVKTDDEIKRCIGGSSHDQTERWGETFSEGMMPRRYGISRDTEWDLAWTDPLSWAMANPYEEGLVLGCFML